MSLILFPSSDSGLGTHAVSFVLRETVVETFSTILLATGRVAFR